MRSTLSELVASFSRLEVLVVGDVILDRYWWGEASRLSPEAPVPVLVKRTATVRPGGAANTAANLAALKAGVDLMGIVGQDREADELRSVLQDGGIRSRGLLSSASRPTTTKTRLIAGHQHIVRLDEEYTGPIEPNLVEAFAAAFAEMVPCCDAVLISDYGKGLLTPVLLQRLLETARQAAKSVFVDPKVLDLVHYRGASFLKPNRLELGFLVGRNIRNHEETLEGGRELRDRLNGTNLLVTEAAEGMTYFGADGQEIHIASEPRQVFDITGAGDTVLAAFALAVSAGAEIAEAMRIASAAAGITIASVGAATVSPDELVAALSPVR